MLDQLPLDSDHCNRPADAFSPKRIHSSLLFCAYRSTRDQKAFKWHMLSPVFSPAADLSEWFIPVHPAIRARLAKSVHPRCRNRCEFHIQGSKIGKFE